MRKAFTLIELIVSIGILSIIMIFLYKSYASLNKSNILYEKKLQTINDKQLKKKIIYLDFFLAFSKEVNILNQDPDADIVFLQTKNSMHARFNPYVAYIFKDKKLYRLESLKRFNEYPLDPQSDFSMEYFGEAEIFRVYKSQKKDANSFLVHINFGKQDTILLKIKQPH